MFGKFFKKISPLESFVIVAVCALLIVFCALLVRNVQIARREGVFQSRAPISGMLLENRRMNRVSVSDIERIETWMTFQYVNVVFDLPENHLKDALAIKDARYPNLPIGRYAKKQEIDRDQFVESVKKLVREYMEARPGK